MIKLADILYKAGAVEINGHTNKTVNNVHFDSRKVDKGSLFVAIKGLTTDGHIFIESAVENGANCIVCEKFPEKLSSDVTYVKVKNSSFALAVIAANFYGNPSEEIKLIGVTGTNGKTTTTTLLHALFNKLGQKSGLISTINYKIADKSLPALFTTPDSLQINLLLRQMIDEGCKYCFMEVSSHAVSQNRVSALKFSGGVFTNLSQDHLDYHNSFQEYLETKKSFFDNLPADAFALTNADDKNGWVMLQNSKAKKYSYSLHSVADFKAKIIDNQISGLGLEIIGIEAWFKLVGKFNAYNILAIFATANILGLDIKNALTALSGFESVEGRFQHIISNNKINIIIDYAHTPDALENVLKTLREVNNDSKARIITVFGCGGNRDKTKRPLMGSLAAKYSDKIVITDDNPRNENPVYITNDIVNGLDDEGRAKSLVINNRKEAIKTAIALAEKNDIVLVAGKGHEKYQEINGVRHHFDDEKVVKEIIDR